MPSRILVDMRSIGMSPLRRAVVLQSSDDRSTCAGVGHVQTIFGTRGEAER
jgi:hypothetical protein